MRTCPDCAEEVAPNDEFCSYCDADLAARRSRSRSRERASDIGDDAAMRMVLPVGRSGWAIAAGYLGLFSLICFPAPFALVVGIIAFLDIKKNPDKHGMGRAIFGIVMGVLGSIGLVLMIISAFVG